METKIAKLRSMWHARDYIGALRMAASFASLGEQSDAIRRGWDAHNRPDFYRQLRKDPAALVAAGIAAVAARYGLDAP